MSLPQLSAASPAYVRRRPEETVLHQIVREHWPTFRTEAEASGKSLPYYVEREFEAFLSCGVLAHGFVRLKCGDCRHEKLVAFSCKRRGFCPSCAGRRMAETGAFLADQVFPRVPVRQWVLSVPIPLRFWMAGNPKLMGLVLGIVSRALAGFYRTRAAARGAKCGQTGAVTFIQRFGGSINLNVHFHQLWIEGVFVKPGQDGCPEYRFVPRPTDAAVVECLSVIRRRILRLLVKKGYLEVDERPVGLGNDGFEGDEPLMGVLWAASAQGRVATGSRKGLRVRRMGSFGEPGERPELTGPLCAGLGGFSLHAQIVIEVGKPEKLERLCRYVARPPVAESRLFPTDTGEIGYSLKSRWSDGTFAVRFSAPEFIEKLVALIPQPRIHLTRYHGVLAPHHSWRSEIVPAASAVGDNKTARASHRRRMTWAELLKRVFQIDLTTCPDCGGKVAFIAAIMKREVIIKILEPLQIPTALPEWGQARSPPTLAFDF